MAWVNMLVKTGGNQYKIAWRLQFKVMQIPHISILLIINLQLKQYVSNDAIGRSCLFMGKVVKHDKITYYNELCYMSQILEPSIRELIFVGDLRHTQSIYQHILQITTFSNI